MAEVGSVTSVSEVGQKADFQLKTLYPTIALYNHLNTFLTFLRNRKPKTNIRAMITPFSVPFMVRPLAPTNCSMKMAWNAVYNVPKTDNLMIVFIDI